jgi:uncharacterized protein (TIGR02145 family)
MSTPKALLIGLITIILSLSGNNLFSQSLGDGNINTGTFIDERDGLEYDWKRMNDGKIWMAENLNFISPYSWCYDYDLNNCEKYGRLYTWSDALKACPKGWHLPSAEEWWDLSSAYGGAYSLKNDNYGEEAGKLAYKSLFDKLNGFFPTLGGYRYAGQFQSNGQFFYLNENGNYWSSNRYEGYAQGKAMAYTFSGNHEDLVEVKSDEIFAYSCRCVKDEIEGADITFPEDSIALLIKNLSWESIRTVAKDGKIWINPKADFSVNNLIKIGTPAIPSLIEHIGHPDKTIAIHIILSKIVDPTWSSSTIDTLRIYKDCSTLIGHHNVYRSITWEYFSDEGYSISKREINSVNDFWRYKMQEKTDVLLQEAGGVIEALRNQDKLKYPCNFINENNSGKISARGLTNLIEKQVDDPKLISIFSILGEDSVEEKYPEYQFYAFPNDGLEFVFTKGKLTTIYIEPDYRGKMPKNIKFSDTYEMIKKKLGDHYNYASSSSGDGERYGYLFKGVLVVVTFTSPTSIKHIRMSIIDEE